MDCGGCKHSFYEKDTNFYGCRKNAENKKGQENQRCPYFEDEKIPP